MIRRTTKTRSGFTILELIIVVLVLVLLASLTMPRLVGQERRALELAADQVTDLLTMFSQRESMANRSIGLSYDAEQNWLMLMVLDVANAQSGVSTLWHVDSIVGPAKLPDGVTVWEVRADGEPVDITAWPLSHTPGEERPAIEITLTTEEQAATIMLDPFSVAARRIDGDDDIAALRSPIDLDNIGLAREDW